MASALNSGGTGLGLYQANAPRFTGPARRLLSEGPTTNFVQQPVAVSSPTGAWSQGGGGTAAATITRNFSVSPGGLQDAARVRWVGPNAGTVSLRVPTSGVPVGTVCTVSFWAFTRSLGNATSALVDLLDGPVSANLLPQFILNQAARIVAGGIVSGSNATSQWVDLAFSGFTTGEIDFDCWGIQGETGSFATSLVLPPAATPGESTRNGDSVSASLASLKVTTGVTMLWSGLIPAAPAVAGEQTILHVDDGTTSNRYRLINEAGSGNILLSRSLGGGLQNALTPGGARPTNSIFRVGMSVDISAGTAISSLNGGATATVTGGPSSGLAQFRSGLTPGGAAPLFGETGVLRIIPRAVSSGELQSLTGAMP